MIDELEELKEPMLLTHTSKLWLHHELRILCPTCGLVHNWTYNSGLNKENIEYGKNCVLREFQIKHIMNCEREKYRKEQLNEGDKNG